MADDTIQALGGKLNVKQGEPALLMEAGYLLLELNKFQEAEEVFNGVAALLPASEVPHVALGNLYFSQGRWNQALKAHKDALKVRPDSALANAHMGEVLLFMKKPDEAVKALQKAQSMSGDDSNAAEFAKSLLEAHEMGVFDNV
jgi:tetratricopeptide (TPR) repeat protein